MPCPIEEPLVHTLDMLPIDGPQAPLLTASSYSQFVKAAAKMKCTCCPLGACNQGPPILDERPVNNRIGRVVFIGEGPGEQEQIMGSTFCGPAGMKLRHEMFSQARVPANACHFINLVKCRAYDTMYNKYDVSTPLFKDRPPRIAEIQACFQLLLKQLTFVNPALIVFIGSSAAKYSLGLKTSFKITKSIGYGCPILVNESVVNSVVIPHPSYFLREGGRVDTAAYSATISVLARISDMVLNNEPFTYKLFAEDEFATKQKPLYYSATSVFNERFIA